MNQVKKLIPKQKSYKYNWRNTEYQIEFDDKHIYCHWKSRFTSGKKTHMLHILSSKIDICSAYNMEVFRFARIALLLILISMVIYFSEYQTKIPLLSPLLVIVALFILPKSPSYFKKETWAYIYDSNGNIETQYLIPNNETEQAQERRESFQNNLSKQIEKAVDQEYYE
jgi:hypothetical protein